MKPIINAGGGYSAPDVTEYTRNLEVKAWIINGPSEFNDGAIHKDTTIIQPLIFEHGYDDNGGPGSIINEDEILELYLPDVIDVFPGTKYNYLFPQFQAEVDAYNEGKSFIDRRSLWSKAEDPNKKTPMYNLQIGSQVDGIADDCFSNYQTVRSTTRFSKNNINIGKRAFENFGTVGSNQFEDMVNLIIEEKSFYSAHCGRVVLKDCDLTLAKNAFQNAKIELVGNPQDFTVSSCIGDKIPEYFAEGAKVRYIQLDMQDQAPIEQYAFHNCDAKGLSIWDGCLSIGKEAFSKNNFGYSLLKLPGTIDSYGDSCFQDSQIKELVMDLNANAVFGKKCFYNNAIDSPSLVLWGRTFDDQSFQSAIRQTYQPSVFEIRGSNVRELAFADNIFDSVFMGASIIEDSAFRRCSINKVTIDEPINGRHTFSVDSNRYGSREYILNDPSHLANSYRTFQRGDFYHESFGLPDQFPRPVGTILYFPRTSGQYNEISDLGANFESKYDFGALTYGEAVAYSNANPGIQIDWRTTSPESFDVNFGSHIATLELDDPLEISGTLSTIQRGGYYTEDFPGSPEGGYDPDTGGIGFDYYNITVQFIPWGDRVSDLNVVAGDQGFDPVPNGKGVWTAQGSSNSFAPQSPIFWEGRLSDPAGVSTNSTHPDGAYVSDIVSVNFVTPSLYENGNGVVSKLDADRMGDASFHVHLQPNFSGDTLQSEILFVPQSYAETADSDAFRLKHCFLGDVVGI